MNYVSCKFLHIGVEMVVTYFFKDYKALLLKLFLDSLVGFHIALRLKHFLWHYSILVDDTRLLIDGNGTLSCISRDLVQCQTRGWMMNVEDLQHQLEELGPSQALVELMTTSTLRGLELWIWSVYTNSSQSGMIFDSSIYS